MDASIRKVNLSKQDIESFVGVYKSAYKGMEEYAYKKEKSIRHYFKWLFKRDRDGFFVAELDGNAIGFVACDSNWHNLFNEKMGEIHELAIKQEYKGKGIGKKLMETAEEYLKSKGHEKFGLWVGENNKKAIKFYEKLGYKKRDKFGIWIRMEKYETKSI